jgi:hypothetical protein
LRSYSIISFSISNYYYSSFLGCTNGAGLDLTTGICEAEGAALKEELLIGSDLTCGCGLSAFFVSDLTCSNRSSTFPLL